MMVPLIEQIRDPLELNQTEVIENDAYDQADFEHFEAAFGIDLQAMG